MVYLDTNVLIYATIEQDIAKKETSIRLIETLSQTNKLVLSPLVLQEYIYTLSRLKVDKDIIDYDVLFYREYLCDNYNKDMLIEAMQKCLKIESCKNINDFLHIEIAQKVANKLITFDSDFKKVQKFTKLQIDILC